MKLVHQDYSFQIEFEENVVQKLIIESPHTLSSFLVELKRQINGKEGKWVLSQEGEVLEISDHMELIIDLFDLQINQRKILKKLYDQIIQEINSTELLIEWTQLNSAWESMLNKATSNLEYNLEYESCDIRSFLKMINVQFKEEEKGYFEYLLEYLQLQSEVRNIRIFCIVNCTSFLTEEEIAFLYEHACYKKLFLILLETKNISVNSEIEKTVIIDSDCCIINLYMK